MKNMKFGFPMADEKREIEIKETRLKKRGLLMECKEMESLNTRKLNDVLSLRKFAFDWNPSAAFQEPKSPLSRYL